MASSSQTLNTNIVINAKVGNGFSDIGNTLAQMASIIQPVSDKLIDFGKQSIEVYRGYEKSMADAEVALSTTYGRNTQELSSTMSQLDAAATQWAATTIFHTDDVGNAISEAAHAGWDFNQIMNGIPAAMQLAQAGGLDLSEAVNYIVKSANGLGLEFDEDGKSLTNFIDLWTYAANSSASTVEEFGDAMLRMGSTMRFADSTEELMTLLAVTANAGAVGSDAGTLIRNSILRLAAPTDKATEAMAELGATSEETSEIMNDEALSAANAELAESGFSAYDDKGQLKSTLETYQDLYQALGQIAGGYDKIEKNKDALKILQTVFGTRTVTEALTLLRGASEQWDGLYESMKNGEAEGYGEYASETMMNTLDGRIETFKSKIERLQQLVGESLSDPLSNAMGAIGGIVDEISNLDPGTLDVLVSGLTGVALTGPGLVAVSGAFRLIGTLLGPAGAVAGAVTTLAALAGAMQQVNENKIDSVFGTGTLDQTEIQSALSQMESSYDSATSTIHEFRDAVTEAANNYDTASAQLASSLTTKLISGLTLTDADQTKIEGYADTMVTSMVDAISNSAAAQMSTLNLLFGGDGEAENNPAYQDSIELLEKSMNQGIANAEALGQKLRNAITDAWKDGSLSEEERSNILGVVQDMNNEISKAQLEQTKENQYVETQKLKYKAQHASRDEIKTVAKEIQESSDKMLSDAQDQYLDSKYTLEYQWDQAIQNHEKINGEYATEERKKAVLAELDDNYNAYKAQLTSGQNNMLYTLWSTNLKESDAGTAYENLQKLAEGVDSGTQSMSDAIQSFTSEYGDIFRNRSNPEMQALREGLASMITGWGGYDQIAESYQSLMKAGDSESVALANHMAQVYTMDQILNNYGQQAMKDYTHGLLGFMYDKNGTFWTSNEDVYHDSGPGEQNKDAFDTFLNSVYSALGITNTALEEQSQQATEQSASIEATVTSAKEALEDTNTTLENSGKSLEENTKQTTESGAKSENAWSNLGNVLGSLGNSVISLLNTSPKDTATSEVSTTPTATAEGTANISISADAAQALAELQQQFNSYGFSVTIEPNLDEGAIKQPDPIPVELDPYVGGKGESAADQLAGQGVDVNVNGDTTNLQATIKAEDGQKLLSYVDGDASDLHMSIQDENGQYLLENVDGNTAALASAINAYQGRTITVNVVAHTSSVAGAVSRIGAGASGFAEGGRATEASIFGEAGPEWAIPEEHTAATASLLDQARAASGFTWPDLLSMVGAGGSSSGSSSGSSGSESGSSATLVYSPTINATDVTGVAKELKDDKERFERWYEEKQRRDRLEVYA